MCQLFTGRYIWFPRDHGGGARPKVSLHAIDNFEFRQRSKLSGNVDSCNLQLNRSAKMASVKTKWTREMEDVLVEAWGERECLYNLTLKEYHIREKKEKAWYEISCLLGIPGVCSR